MPRWWTTLLKLSPVVAGTSLASMLGVIAVRQLVPVSTLQGSSDSVGNYLQTVGGIYAVLLAFVVYVVWGQFNEARGYVAREAASIVDLHRTAGGLPSETRDEIQHRLRDYLQMVLSDEWRAMAVRDEGVLERGSAELDAIWTAIHECEPLNDCQHTIYGEVVSRFNDLSDVRTSRMTSAWTRIPQAIKMLLYAGALIMIGSMYLLAFPELWIHAIVTGALAGAVAHILYIVRDLDDAFSGDWQVSKAPFQRALRHIERAAVTAA